jgi:hypothetical protein
MTVANVPASPSHGDIVGHQLARGGRTSRRGGGESGNRLAILAVVGAFLTTARYGRHNSMRRQEIGNPGQ